MVGNIEDPNLRRLLGEIINALVSAQNNLIANLSNQGRATRQTVDNSATRIQGTIGLQAAATRNTVQSSQTRIISNQNKQTSRMAQLIDIARDDINTRQSGFAARSINFLQDVQRNLATRLAQESQQTDQNVDQAENNILSSLALAGSRIIGNVNEGTEIVRAGLQDVGNQVSEVTGNIGIEIEQGLRNAAEGIRTALENLLAPLIAFIEGILETITEWWNNNIAGIFPEIRAKIDLILEIFRRLISGDIKSIDQIINLMTPLDQSFGLISIGIFALILVPNVMNAFGALFQPYAQQLTNLTMPIAQSTLLPPDMLVRLLWRGEISSLDAITQLSQHGFSPENIQSIFTGAKQLLGVGEIRDLVHRSIIDLSEAETRLSKLGFGDTEVSNITDLFEQLPPIQDVILFAVREAFNQDIVTKFGLDEDIPEDILFAEAEKRGLDRQNALFYWRSHWDLPGIRDGFEMFHRRVITADELELLLRTKDVMPFWRDKLTQISFSLPTRVDIRRMFHIGEVSREQVKEFYRDTGYATDVAEALTRFTEIEYAPDDTRPETDIRLLSRSVVERAFVRGLINRKDAIAGLIELRYPEDSAELLLDLASFNKTVDAFEDLRDDFDRRIRSLVIKLYTRRTIPAIQALEQLGTLGFTEAEAQQLLDIADLEFDMLLQDDIISTFQQMLIDRTIQPAEVIDLFASFGYNNAETEKLFENLFLLQQLRDRKPTRAQFEGFVKRGIISLEQYAEELRGLQYAEQYVQMYLAQLEQE